MSKIKIFGMGGLDENGKNTYIVEVDNKIFILDVLGHIKSIRYDENLNNRGG